MNYLEVPPFNVDSPPIRGIYKDQSDYSSHKKVRFKMQVIYKSVNYYYTGNIGTAIKYI